MTVSHYTSYTFSCAPAANPTLDNTYIHTSMLLVTAARRLMMIRCTHIHTPSSFIPSRHTHATATSPPPAAACRTACPPACPLLDPIYSPPAALPPSQADRFPSYMARSPGGSNSNRTQSCRMAAIPRHASTAKVWSEMVLPPAPRSGTGARVCGSTGWHRWWRAPRPPFSSATTSAARRAPAPPVP